MSKHGTKKPHPPTVDVAKESMRDHWVAAPIEQATQPQAGLAGPAAVELLRAQRATVQQVVRAASTLKAAGDRHAQLSEARATAYDAHLKRIDSLRARHVAAVEAAHQSYQSALARVSAQFEGAIDGAAKRHAEFEERARSELATLHVQIAAANAALASLGAG